MKQERKKMAKNETKICARDRFRMHRRRQMSISCCVLQLQASIWFIETNTMCDSNLGSWLSLSRYSSRAVFIYLHFYSMFMVHCVYVSIVSLFFFFFLLCCLLSIIKINSLDNIIAIALHFNWCQSIEHIVQLLNGNRLNESRWCRCRCRFSRLSLCHTLSMCFIIASFAGWKFEISSFFLFSLMLHSQNFSSALRFVSHDAHSAQKRFRFPCSQINCSLDWILNFL